MGAKQHPVAGWRKSTYSGQIDCVEVAPGAGGEVLLRHSRRPHDPWLACTADVWRAFVVGVKAGDLDG